MFIKLTTMDNKKLLIKKDIIYAVAEDGNSSIIATSDGKERVKENFEEIEKMLIS